jgi:hypothetical protein
VSAIKKITTVFLFQLLQFDYEVWEIIIYFTTCFSFWSLFYWTSFWSWTIGQTGRKKISAEDHTNMIYYNCCGIRPKHSNISKRVGKGVFTICVVLDQSTVIFQKGGGDYNLCGIEIKIMAMLCFISWLLICRVCSHPRRFSISITNQ